MIAIILWPTWIIGKDVIDRLKILIPAHVVDCAMTRVNYVCGEGVNDEYTRRGFGIPMTLTLKSLRGKIAGFLEYLFAFFPRLPVHG